MVLIKGTEPVKGKERDRDAWGRLGAQAKELSATLGRLVNVATLRNQKEGLVSSPMPHFECDISSNILCDYNYSVTPLTSCAG